MGEKVNLWITDFVRSISPTDLDLHPIFDYEWIEKGGAYKYWDVPSKLIWFWGFSNHLDYSNISIKVKITCSDKKGTLTFYFDGISIYSHFDFDGKATVLNSILYREVAKFVSIGDKVLSFSREDLFNQRDRPVLVAFDSGLDPIYDYFLYMDRMIRIDKELGDFDKRMDLVREFYLREKQAGRFVSEELAEKRKLDDVAEDQRRIPENVKREVWRRDGGKCSHCGSRNQLEYDHIVPFSKGGSNTARNVELLCMMCNRKKSNNV